MAFPAIVFFLLVFTVPETPRWLFQVGRRDEAVERYIDIMSLAAAEAETQSKPKDQGKDKKDGVG